MSLAKILRQNYPTAQWGPQHSRDPTTWDIMLVDHCDGRGQLIETWNEKKLGPKPTSEQIAKWLSEYKPPAPPTKDERLAKFFEREGLTIADFKAALAK